MAVPKKKEPECCKPGHFPTFAVILLVVGILWLLNDLKIFTIEIPWVPIVVIVIAIGMLFNKFVKK